MSLAELRDAWLARWPEALAVWSKFTRLRDPQWCSTDKSARRAGIEQSLARIRLQDQSIAVNLLFVQQVHV